VAGLELLVAATWLELETAVLVALDTGVVLPVLTVVPVAGLLVLDISASGSLALDVSAAGSLTLDVSVAGSLTLDVSVAGSLALDVSAAGSLALDVSVAGSLTLDVSELDVSALGVLPVASPFAAFADVASTPPKVKVATKAKTYP